MKNLILIGALLTLSSIAHAQKIGPAGCGLGNVVFGAENQIIAATLNATGVQTFGITTGTSNCGEGFVGAQLENYIEVNQVALSNDVARGEGETISGLAQILGCSDAQALGAELKSNYSDIFARPAATSAELSSGVRNAVQKNAELSRSCGNV